MAGVCFAGAALFGWKSLGMFFASAHFGSPALQLCSSVYGKTPDFVRACSIFRRQLFAVIGQYGDALMYMGVAAFALFVMATLLLCMSFGPLGSPPNNSFKPKPLRGSA